jgi:N5-(carboxyethyl)ornithine synthase
MKEVGFVKSSMPGEERAALLPSDVREMTFPDKLFFEKGYAVHLGIEDSEYERAGAKIVSRKEAYEKEVLCIPKPWIDDVEWFRQGQVLMGWLYLAEKKKITEAVLAKKMTAIAWEDLYGPKKEYAFEKNRWYAGYIAVTQALPFAKASPKNLKIAVLGNGRVAKGAFDRLREEGAQYEVFGTNLLSGSGDITADDLRSILRKFVSRISEFDVVVNCWYYDPAFGNYLSLDDLQEMKAGALFIDVSSEGVEGSIPHPDLTPMYKLGRFNPIIVYNNNHAPSYWPLEVSQSISKDWAPLLDRFMRGVEHPMLTRALAVDAGVVIDKRINKLMGKGV